MLATNITSLDPDHISEAVRLWEATEHIGLSTSDSPDGLAAFLTKNPGLSFVAINSGHLVGTILCGSDGRRGYIHHLAVAEHYRNHGIGSELLARSLAALAKIRITKCHAFVFHDNPHAELFWGAGGWELREDLLVYSKVLSAGA